MADVHEPHIRSYNMSQIKGKNTKPEMLVRKFLHSLGLRYKLHDKTLPGKPDLVFPKYNTIVFVQGCFWHQHKNCKHASVPKTRTDWWSDKLNKNVQRDKKNFNELINLGWAILVVWECEIDTFTLNKLYNHIIDNAV